MLKRILSLLIVFAIMALSYGCSTKNKTQENPSSANNVEETKTSMQKFDDLEDNDMLKYPWVTSGTVNLSTDPTNPENKVVYIEDTVTSNQSVADLFFNRTTNKTRLSVDLCIPEYGEWNVAVFPDDAANYSQIVIGGNDTGAITYYNFADSCLIDSYKLGEWFNLAITVYPEDGLFDIEINGEKKVTSAQFKRSGADFKYIGGLRIGTSYSKMGKVYFDNVIAPDIKLISLKKIVPEYKNIETLSSTPETSNMLYHGFPSLEWVSDTDVVIVYHRGVKHAYSHGVLEAIRYNTVEEKVVWTKVLQDVPNQNAQNAEIFKMPNGEVVIYLEMQEENTSAASIVNVKFSSTDGFETWTYDDKGLFDNAGFQYSSIYDTVVVGNDVYALAYARKNISGTGSSFVAVIKTSDNGKNWQLVKDLTHDLKYNFNESTIEPYNDGYVIVARGEKKVTQAIYLDSKFNKISDRNLRLDFECIGHVGKPLLFQENGNYYLLIRNILPDSNNEMRLTLHKFNPETLAVESFVELEPNNTGNNGGDGFYAEYYMTSKNGEEYVNVITYSKAYSTTNKPTIIRLEYKKDEIL